MKKKKILRDRYSIIKKIGEGSFGQVFHARDLITKEDVAIKVDKTNKRYDSSFLHEKNILSILQQEVEEIVDGIPKLKWFGLAEENKIMVMELLGPSLNNIFNDRGKKFTLMTVLKLGYQILCRIEYLHSKNIIHRDIKPQNFVLGLGSKAGHIYIIDFGVAKKYIDDDTKKHICYKANRPVVGTRVFCSVNTLHGIEQSRRDDLEALGYTLIYLLVGKLPWSVPGKLTEEKKRKIEEIKVPTTIQELCEGCPKELREYINYCKNLRFESKPDYEYLKGLFIDGLTREGHALDNVFDWTISRDKKLRAKTSIDLSCRDALGPCPTAATDNQCEKFKEDTLDLGGK